MSATRRLISFIGGGTMARGLIGGLVRHGYPKQQIMVSSPGADKLQALAAEFGIHIAKSNSMAIEHADVAVLAVKPKIIEAVCTETAKVAAVKKPLFISLASGVKVDSIDRWLGGNQAVVRTMTNLSVTVGKGMTALFANPATSREQKEMAANIFDMSGNSMWVDSELALNKVTALIGCTPALAAYIVECMQSAASKTGLPPAIAKNIALQALSGAVTVLQETKVSPEELRKKVTTPGGVTEAFLAPLQKDRLFSKAFDEAFAAGEERCYELANLGKQPAAKPPSR